MVDVRGFLILILYASNAIGLYRSQEPARFARQNEITNHFTFTQSSKHLLFNMLTSNLTYDDDNPIKQQKPYETNLSIRPFNYLAMIMMRTYIQALSLPFLEKKEGAWNQHAIDRSTAAIGELIPFVLVYWKSEQVPFSRGVA